MSDDDNPFARRAFVAGLLSVGLPAEAGPMTARRDGPHQCGSGWLEWRLTLSTEGSFDPAQFDIGCDFTGPPGKTLKVTAFWDDRQWRLRLLPPIAGLWRATPRGLVQQRFTFMANTVAARQHIGIDPFRRGRIEGCRARADGLALSNGRVQVGWIDPHSGERVASTDTLMQACAPELPCPVFTRDSSAIVSQP